jgi:hypothetical protein
MARAGSAPLHDRKAWLDQLIEAGRLALHRSPEFVRLRDSLGEGAAEI